MKQVLMSAIVLATVLTAKAQVGSILVGGNIDLTTNKNKSTDVKTTSFSFNPTVGYQFNNNWTAGLTAAIASNKQEQGSPVTTYKNNSFAVGPFVRYARPISNTFAVYGQLQSVIGSGKVKTLSGDVLTSSSKFSTVDIDLFPAVFINLKNSFGLNFNIGGLSYGSTKPKGASSSNTFNFNFGKVLGIGISKNFGGKK